MVITMITCLMEALARGGAGRGSSRQAPVATPGRLAGLAGLAYTLPQRVAATAEATQNKNRTNTHLDIQLFGRPFFDEGFMTWC